MIPGIKTRTPDRWAPRRGFWPLPDSGFPWARTPAGPGDGHTTTTSERRRGGDGSRSRSVALPTTGTRLARRGAPRHAAPVPARTVTRAARATVASIHSLRTQLFIRFARRTRGTARWHHHVSAQHVLALLPPTPARPALPPRLRSEHAH